MRKFKLYSTLFLSTFGFIFLYSNVNGQEPATDSTLIKRINDLEAQVNYKKSGEEHFLVAGLATFGFVSNKTTINSNGTSQVIKTNSLADADRYEFSPMFLWRHGNRFLLEFEASFDGYTVGVNWADVSYFAAPGLIIRAGYIVLPFGIYNKRLAAGWIDKLPTDPIGVADVPPTSDFGVEVEGGFPLGNMKWNYDIAVSNGMQLTTDGELQGVGIVDNNQNKTITGRLGLLPFKNSSLEIGVSGMFGTVGDANSQFQSATSNNYAFDLNYVKLFSPILVNIKGQYNYTDVSKQQYIKPEDSTLYSFDNKVTSYFAQLSLRPTGASSNFVKNLEAAFRIGNYTTPNNSLWGQKSDYVEAGLMYWFSWRSVLKLGYQSNNINSKALDDQTTTTKSDSYFIQFAIQL
jgi:hypothetical protein